MNLDTVLMCAKMAAAKQQAGLGYVDPEIQALIDELTPAEAAPAPVEVVAEMPADVVEPTEEEVEAHFAKVEAAEEPKE